MTKQIILLAVLQLLFVFVGTIKSIYTVKGSPTSAATMNTISTVIGALGTKVFTQQSFLVITVVMGITTYIGSWFAKMVVDVWMKKEKLWTIVAVIKNDDASKVEEALLQRSIQFTYTEAQNSRSIFTIFSYTRAESILVKEILDKYSIRFSIQESFQEF